MLVFSYKKYITGQVQTRMDDRFMKSRFFSRDCGSAMSVFYQQGLFEPALNLGHE